MNADTNNLSQFQSLLGGQSSSGSGVSLFDTNALLKALMPLTIIATIMSIIIAILYLFNIIQRMRVDRAVIESRNILREMNAREKAKETSVEAPVQAPAPVATDQ